MQRIYNLLVVLSVAVGLIACGQANKPADSNDKASDSNEAAELIANKIVSLDGAYTEWLVYLSATNQLVGIDVTSNFPFDSLMDIPQLGHISGVSVEEIVKQGATHVLYPQNGINSDKIEALKQVGIQLVELPKVNSIESARQVVTQLYGLTKSDKDLTEIFHVFKNPIDTTTITEKKKVIFVYARGQGTLLVAGNNTVYQTMVELAGAEYAFKNFESFKPLTSEAVVEANPDVILLFKSGMFSLEGPEGVLKVPGVEFTNAGKNKEIISMESALLSHLGPRTQEAITELHNKIYAKEN